MTDKIKIEKVIYEMQNLLDEATHFPLSKKVGVDKETMLFLLDELQQALPYELETAIKILNEQESILASANKDASYIIEEANKERERMIEECRTTIDDRFRQMESDIEEMMRDVNLKAEELISENRIMKEAKAKAERLINEATQYSHEVKEGALAYSRDKLEIVESSLNALLQEVVNDKNSL